MQPPLTESFEMFSRREHRDMESRQRLTELLQEQIDQNEELRLENVALVENQRKLLQLLELRDQMLARGVTAKHPNDSTFEQTRLLNDTVRHQLSPQKNPEQQGQLLAELQSLKASYEATRSANVSLQHRLSSLNALLLQKDEEVEKARLYNHEVYQKMEEQHEQDERQSLRLKEKLYAATLELESRRKELLEVGKASDDAKQEQARMLQQREERLRDELDEAQTARDRAFRERDQALTVSQNALLEHRAKAKELAAELAESRKQAEQLEEHLASSLQELKDKYQLVSRQEEELKALKQQLEKKSRQNQELTEKLTSVESELHNESMRDGQAVAELQEVVGRLKKEMDLQIRNNNTLRKEIIELEKQAKSRQESEITESSKLEEMQLTLEQLKNRNEREKEQTERTIERLQRDVERRDKQLLQNKKLVKEMESELENRQQTIEDLEEELKKKAETAATKEKKLKDELQRSLEEAEKVRNENRLLKRELENMEVRVNAMVGGMQQKIVSLTNQLQQSKSEVKSLANDNEHLKRLYEKSEIELSDAHEILEAKQREVQALRRRTTDMEKELQGASLQIDALVTDQSKEQEIVKLKQELNESKIRIVSLSEANSRMKSHNTELVRDTMGHNEFKKTIEAELEKAKSESKQVRQEKASLESKIATLEQTLQDQSTQLERSSPYITRLVEEKKMLELDKTKMQNEIKSYQHLIDVAKKTKAEEIVNLNREVASLKKKLEEVPATINQELTQLKKLQAKYEQQIRQANKTIENNNRDKVNMLRQNTVRQDHYMKVEKDNMQLREDKRSLQAEIKRMQALFDQYQKHLHVATRIANQYPESSEPYEPVTRQSRLTADPPAPSKTLDVSPIRSASHTRAHVPSTEGHRNVGHSLPGSSNLQRHEVQQRIRGYQRDILGAD